MRVKHLKGFLHPTTEDSLKLTVQDPSNPQKTIPVVGLVFHKDKWIFITTKARADELDH